MICVETEGVNHFFFAIRGVDIGHPLASCTPTTFYFFIPFFFLQSAACFAYGDIIEFCASRSELCAVCGQVRLNRNAMVAFKSPLFRIHHNGC